MGPGGVDSNAARVGFCEPVRGSEADRGARQEAPMEAVAAAVRGRGAERRGARRSHLRRADG